MITVDNSTPTSTASSVAELLLRVRHGDPSAWNEIVRRYGKLVSTTVRSFGLQDADALDAEQTTWLRLAEKVHQIQHPERLGGWLATTARRECMRILREAKFTLFGAMTESIVDPSANAEQRSIDAEAARTLWNLISELPPRQQAVLRALFSHHPHSYAEVARITGITPGAIGPTRMRALARLKDMLEQRKFQS